MKSQRKTKIKKRKKVPAKQLALYESIFELEKIAVAFDSANEYFSWVADQVKGYNRLNKTRFQEDIVLPYVSWKANEQRNS